jgi:hypothetical protein
MRSNVSGQPGGTRAPGPYTRLEIVGEEDEAAALAWIAGELADDEHAWIHVRGYAQLEWVEDPARGRPEMTGQWHLHFRDGTSVQIDLPLANVEGAITEARTLVAARITGG